MVLIFISEGLPHKKGHVNLSANQAKINFVNECKPALSFLVKRSIPTGEERCCTVSAGRNHNRSIAQLYIEYLCLHLYFTMDKTKKSAHIFFGKKPVISQ